MCIAGCPEFLPDAFETFCADDESVYNFMYVKVLCFSWFIYGSVDGLNTLKMTSTLDNLPKPFVNAMRTLFDIMDDKQTGFVNFADIGKKPKQLGARLRKGIISEARWQDDESKGLPKGVLESLRKVTPPNGMLSFERFCAGLKICLLRNQMESIRPASPETVQDMGKVSHNRPPSVPLLDIPDTSNKPTWVNTAAVRPHIINQQKVSRTYSMPQLKDQQNDNPGFDTKPPLTGEF